MKRADEIWNHGPDLMDDKGEIRELTATDFALLKPFSDLPVDEQVFLLNKGLPDRAEPSQVEELRLNLSRPVLERFRATGTGWEQRVDEALREWIAEHQAS